MAESSRTAVNRNAGAKTACRWTAVVAATAFATLLLLAPVLALMLHVRWRRYYRLLDLVQNPGGDGGHPPQKYPWSLAGPWSPARVMVLGTLGGIVVAIKRPSLATDAPFAYDPGSEQVVQAGHECSLPKCSASPEHPQDEAISACSSLDPKRLAPFRQCRKCRRKMYALTQASRPQWS
ncbi:MAG: hypothetical protein IPH73_14680 [Rhodocyclales bacterium]|nr:hypothetical protein [Rhodocyclales bacterium]